MAEKKIVLRSHKPLVSFTGTKHPVTGTDEYNRPIYGSARTYTFDKFCRYETTPENADDVVSDLQYYIDKNILSLIEFEKIDETPDVNKMNKSQIIEELSKFNVEKIEGMLITDNRLSKQKLLDYLNEVYFQKLNTGDKE